MTSPKHQAADGQRFAVSLVALAGVSAATIGAALTFGGSAVQAGSCTTSTSISGGIDFSCSLPADSVSDKTVEADNPGGSVIINTIPGFGLDVSSGNAVTVAADNITINHTGNSSIRSANGYGIYTRTNSGNGALSIAALGNVSGGLGGIYADNNGTGALTIEAADVEGETEYGIFAANSNAESNGLSITASGKVSGGSRGIGASNKGTGALTIKAVDVEGKTGDGIYALNSNAESTALSITALGKVSGGEWGIYAENQGTGALTIKAADVEGEKKDGITARNFNAESTAPLSITALGKVSGGLAGINANNKGTGALTIDAADVEGEKRDGIFAKNSNAESTGLSITALGKVSGGGRGIYAENHGTGALTIDAADVEGGTGDGIFAGNSNAESTAPLSITASGNVSGGSRGIYAGNDGTGALTIDAADVEGEKKDGIFAENANEESTAPVSITASGKVSGGEWGIHADNKGTGALTIEAAGVEGGTGDGISALNSNAKSTGLSITASGKVSGGVGGIHADNKGTGASTIIVSGDVQGGTGAGIFSKTNVGQLSVIELRDGAVVSATSGNAIINNEGDSKITLRSGSSVVGAVRLGGGKDTLTLEGSADISDATTTFDGGDGAEDEVILSGFTGAFDSTRFANFEAVKASGGSRGINASNNGTGALTIEAADVEGGIHASHNGTGAVTIEAAEDVEGGTGDGIFAENANAESTAPVSITASGKVSGGVGGINADNQGTGALTIKAAEDVEGGTGDGIFAENANAESTAPVSITASGKVSGGVGGINAGNKGTGALTIEAAEDVQGGTGDGIFAENANAESTAPVSITASGKVSGGVGGINAGNKGTGALTIEAAEDVQGGTGDGIFAENANAESTAPVSITASGKVSGGSRGIYAGNKGAGALTLDVADVEGEAQDGIFAENANAESTDLSITASGNVSGGSRGINASNNGTGALTIEAADVEGGIHASHNGTSALTIEAADVKGGTGDGIFAENANAESTAPVSITASGKVSGGEGGISANNKGTGALTIKAAEDVEGGTGDGIFAENANAESTAPVSITASGKVSGGSRGIYADSQGTGALKIEAADVQGGTKDGILAENSNEESTDLSITASGKVSGGVEGIHADNHGTGALTIDAADVEGGTGDGIFAENANAKSTGLSITASGKVSGGEWGIHADNQGTGALTIEAAGVEGGTDDGIFAKNSNAKSTGLSITASGNVSGGQGGINAENMGTGASTIIVSGGVKGGTGAGIFSKTNVGQLSVIELRDGAVVSARSGNAIINNEGDSKITLRSGSSVAGAVRLEDGKDTLTVEDGANISAATTFDGGDGAEDEVIFSGFTGAFDGTLFANFETLKASDGGTLTLNSTSTTPLTFNAIQVGRDATITAQNADFTFDGELRVGVTGRFLAGAGGLGAISLNNNVLNDGLISTVDGKSGDRLTFGATLSGNGTIALDVDLATGANDAVFVTGDSKGARQGVRVNKSGSGNGVTRKFTLVTVSGESTKSDFRLVDADFVTTGGQQALSDGDVAYLMDYDATAGEFVLSPFDNSGGLNSNPGGAFLAAGVQQFSDQLTFGSALDRAMGAPQRGVFEASTASRALNRLTSAKRPIVWVQAEGQRDSYTADDRDVVTNSGGLRFGAGLPLAEIADGQLIGGLEFGVNSLSTDVTTSLASADISTDAYDATLSALWIANSQLYIDGQLRYAYFDGTTRPNGGDAVDTDSTGYGLSIEVGKPLVLQNGLTLVPQAQLMYSDIDTDDVTNLAGGGQTGTLVDGDTLTARLGLRAEHEFAGNSVLFGQVDYYHAFDNETAVAFGQNTILTERGKNTAALTVGGHVALSDRATFHGEVSGKTSLGGNDRDYSFGGNAGFTVRF